MNTQFREITDDAPFEAGDTYQGLPVPAKPLTVIQRAAKALSKEEAEAEITALVQTSKDITAVTDADSREACHEAYIALLKMRTATESRAKEGREEANQYSKAIIAIEKELVALMSPEEKRLKKLRDDFDAIEKAAKQAKIDAEIARVAKVNGLIEAIRRWPVNSATLDSIKLGDVIQMAEAYVVDKAIFEELADTAIDAVATSRLALAQLLAGRIAHEAEQRRIEEERAELAKLRAEQIERDRVAKIQREAEEQKAAEVARLKREDEERIARERQAELDRQAEEQRKAHEAESKRIADERAENDRVIAEQRAALERQETAKREELAAEEKRLADERAKFEADQEAARIAALPKPEPEPEPLTWSPSVDMQSIVPSIMAAAKPRVQMKSADEILTVLANHWGIDKSIAHYFVAAIRWNEVTL